MRISEEFYRPIHAERTHRGCRHTTLHFCALLEFAARSDTGLLTTVVYSVSGNHNLRFSFNHPTSTCFFFWNVFHCPLKDDLTVIILSLVSNSKRKPRQLNTVALDCLNGCLALGHNPELSAWSRTLIPALDTDVPTYPSLLSHPCLPFPSLSCFSSALTVHYDSDIKEETENNPVQPQCSWI